MNVAFDWKIIAYDFVFIFVFAGICRAHGQYKRERNLIETKEKVSKRRSIIIIITLIKEARLDNIYMIKLHIFET